MEKMGLLGHIGNALLEMILITSFADHFAKFGPGGDGIAIYASVQSMLQCGEGISQRGVDCQSLTLMLYGLLVDGLGFQRMAILLCQYKLQGAKAIVKC